MKHIVNAAKGKVILESLRIRSTFSGRLRGFACQKKLRYQTGMFFPDTRRIHTFGMFFPLDIYFFDGSMEFLGKKTHVLPRSFPKSCPGTHHILEIPHTGNLLPLDLEIGDRIAILEKDIL